MLLLIRQAAQQTPQSQLNNSLVPPYNLYNGLLRCAQDVVLITTGQLDSSDPDIDTDTPTWLLRQTSVPIKTQCLHNKAK